MRRIWRTGIVAAVLLCGVVGSGAAHTGDGPHNITPEPECLDPDPEWREGTTIAGVQVQPSERCNPDNPAVVASSVKGTNNVPQEVLDRTGLDESAVRKGEDLDGDGDPDIINITLEAIGLNEFRQNNAIFDIAPGIRPAFWVFAPKTSGMVHRGTDPQELMRMPSPTIRVEEGDRVNIKLENTHYMPHTIHLHGVDHPFSVNGSQNDGVPFTGEGALMPGEEHTYQIQPEQPGTMFYHCHVVPNVHVLMGLNGMFVVEEERDNNTVQTFNIGAGKVRHPSTAVDEEYAAEYDMIYQDVDKELHQIPKEHNAIRNVSHQINREYDLTDADPDYFLLNGRSFPYTLRESIVPVEEDARYRFRVLNSGSRNIALHTHGHKFTVEAVDGVERSESNEVQKDVLDVPPAQRIDFTLNTTVDGLNSYGVGNWIFHDHHETGVTTDGIAPGGTVSMIVYEQFMKDNGMPRTGDMISRYFDRNYYAGEVPYFGHRDASVFGRSAGEQVELEHNDVQASWAIENASLRQDERPEGVVTNALTDRLPRGCESLSGTRNITVRVGTEFADEGEVWGYSDSEVRFNTCERVNVTFVNTDEVRHHWMVQPLPWETYPGDMFSIEADGGGTVSGTFVTPAEPIDLSLHCSVPQHVFKGLGGSVQIVEPSKGALAGDRSEGQKGDLAWFRSVVGPALPW